MNSVTELRYSPPVASDSPSGADSHVPDVLVLALLRSRLDCGNAVAVLVGLPDASIAVGVQRGRTAHLLPETARITDALATLH